MKIAYLDCFSGVSGDMFLGALLDAGLPFEDLRKVLATLPLDGYRIDSETVLRSGIGGLSFKVHLEGREHHH
ncbi:MAG TPA: DUF111 family protein, partial [Desulfobacteraceae bacterium]|nr:DUF111 family protein [Desulfobacteraceae bacterium]